MKKVAAVTVVMVMILTFVFAEISRAAITSETDPTTKVKVQQIKNYKHSQKHDSPEYIPGEVIVKLKNSDDILENKKMVKGETLSVFSSKKQSLKKLMDKHQVTDVKKFIRRNLKQRNRNAKLNELANGLDRIKKFKIKTKDMKEVIKDFNADPNVEYAQPNFIYTAQYIPDDPYYSSSGSWGQSFDDLWGIKRVQANDAWDINDGAGVVVAVIDTGVDYNHADLSGNIWNNTDEIAGNGIDDDGNGYIDDVLGWDYVNDDNDPADDQGHGTHCSGTIAARTNNSIGVSSVAPEVEIMALKFLNASGRGFTDDACLAITYAADNGADVLSNSWGSAGSDPALQDAINYAYAKDCVIVCAAGNSNMNVSGYSPAGCDNVIAVSATDFQDEKASFSNYGFGVAIAAPGVDILSLRGAGTDLYGNGSHKIGFNYLYASGTSMACPHVAGAAALVKAEKPAFTNWDIRNALLVSADDVGSSGKDFYFGSGIVDASQALITDPQILLYMDAYELQDINGNNNGKLDREDGICNLAVDIQNDWLIADNVEIALSLAADDPYITIIDSDNAVGNMTAPSSSTQTFSFSIDSGVPLPHTVDFLVTINADGYSYVNEINMPVEMFTSNNGWPVYNEFVCYTAPPKVDIGNAVVSDIDGDGYKEVIVMTEQYNESDEHSVYVHVYNKDGVLYSQNFPVVIPGVKILKHIAGSGVMAGDIDSSDDELELVAVLYDHDDVMNQITYKTYVINHDGSHFWTDPFERVYANTDGRPKSTSNVIGDLDADGEKEIVITLNNNVVAVSPDQTVLWEKNLSGSFGIESAPAVADLNQDGDLEVILLADNFYVWNPDGSDFPGWPYIVTDMRPPNGHPAPVVGDIDNDGDYEIVFTGVQIGDGPQFHAYISAFHHDGTVVSGWPKYMGIFNLLYTPALSDIDDDGNLEIIVSGYAGAGDGWISVYRHNGDTEAGWPVETEMTGLGSLYYFPNSLANPAADVDGDGEIEILAVGYNGDNPVIYCFNDDGSPLEGFPMAVPCSNMNSVPTITDVDNDGLFEMVFSHFTMPLFSCQWEIEVLRFADWQPSTISMMDWPMFQQNTEHTGVFNPDKNISVMAMDFGSNGLYLKPEGRGFMNYIPHKGWDPEEVVSWNNMLAIDYGLGGLWLYDGTRFIEPLHDSWDPEKLVDWGDKLAIDFEDKEEYGDDVDVYWYDTDNGFVNTYSFSECGDPEDVIAWGNKLAMDCGDNGVYLYDTDNGLTPAPACTDCLNPEGITAWDDKLALDCGDEGVYIYDGTNYYPASTTCQPNCWDADSITLWGDNLVMDFGANSVYIYNGTDYSPTSSCRPPKCWDAESISVWDDDDLVVDFGDKGLYVYDTVNGYSPLLDCTNCWNPENITPWYDFLMIDYGIDEGDGSSGCYVYDGVYDSITKVSDMDPQTMMGVDLAD